MRSTITIRIPKKLQYELDRISKDEGVSRSDVVRESLKDYLFVRRFREVRKGMVAKAGRHGIHTDQDVFDAVS